MTSRTGVGAASVALVGATMLAGGAVDEASRTLTVFAASSLTGAFTEIAEDFERDNPGVRVRLSFGGSSGLVDQIAGGAPADVLASADTATMDRARAAGLVADDPQVFATNVLTLLTPPGNPAGITGLDGSLDGSRLVVCAPAVPCGASALALARAAGVALRPVSEESGATDVRGKVASGEADAGIAYVTDATAAGDRVERVEIAGAQVHPNRYAVAALERTELARGFVDAVTGAEGRAVLGSFGFGPP
ncbi:molybdate ABC transporter substrate-binding protein [uncultured Dietzia sp.]|uniref:molybdate ABC transporter substrate-binding protein n=1 Tax=uncultured Dietzia sp. TaxID=395519 RepID=UPI0026272B81|nr:molybdate ABC transporter substrate-binding protein [uncultured Dietzia sp.]